MYYVLFMGGDVLMYGVLYAIGDVSFSFAGFAGSASSAGSANPGKAFLLKRLA
jgi:hypothetical protein